MSWCLRRSIKLNWFISWIDWLTYKKSISTHCFVVCRISINQWTRNNFIRMRFECAKTIIERKIIKRNTKNDLYKNSFKNLFKSNKIYLSSYWKNHEWLSFYCFESRCFSNIHEVKTQKVCECQNVSLNENALVLFSSNYINWLFDYLSAKIVLFNIFSQHSSVSSAQYSNEFNLIWNFRANSLNDADFAFSTMSSRAFSAMWLLQRCIVWNFRASFFDDVDFVKLNHTSMRKLQKWTNRNSIIYWFQIWRKIEL